MYHREQPGVRAPFIGGVRRRTHVSSSKFLIGLAIEMLESTWYVIKGHLLLCLGFTLDALYNVSTYTYIFYFLSLEYKTIIKIHLRYERKDLRELLSCLCNYFVYKIVVIYKNIKVTLPR